MLFRRSNTLRYKGLQTDNILEKLTHVVSAEGAKRDNVCCTLISQAKGQKILKHLLGVLFPFALHFRNAFFFA